MKLTDLPTIEPIVPVFKPLDYIPSSRISYYWEPKFNGIRCLLYWTRESGFYFSSRTDYRIRYVYKEFQDALSELFNSQPLNDFILDGELIAVTGQHLEGDLALLSNRANVKVILQYRCFDVVWAGDKPLVDYTLRIRKAILQKFFGEFSKSLVFKLVPYDTNKDVLPTNFHSEEHGYLLKDTMSSYRSGRQISWLRLKKENSHKFYVTGVTPGIGSQYNTFGGLLLVDQTFEPVGSVYLGITDEARDVIWRWISENCKDEWRTFEVEVSYNRRTTDNQLHNPHLISWRFSGE